MTLLKIGPRFLNLDRLTSVEDIPATGRGSGRGKGKAAGGGGGTAGGRGGIRVTFEGGNTVDFTDEEAEDLLRFLEAHSYLPPPGPVEPIEGGA